MRWHHSAQSWLDPGRTSELRICEVVVAGVGCGSWILSDLSTNEPGTGLRACALYSVVNLCSRCVLVDERTETIEIRGCSSLSDDRLQLPQLCVGTKTPVTLEWKKKPQT